MIELDGAALFHASLLAVVAIVVAVVVPAVLYTRGDRRGRQGVTAGGLLVGGCRVVPCLCTRSLWVLPSTCARRIKRDGLAVGRSDYVCSVGCWGAKLSFGAFDAVVRLGLLPVVVIGGGGGGGGGVVSVVEESAWAGLAMRALGLVCSACDRLDGSAHRRCDADSIRVVSRTAFNSVAGR